MLNWIMKKMQGGRYLMNLTQLENYLSELSPQQRAKVVATAFDFVLNIRENDLVTGHALWNAITSATTAASLAQQLYELIEDQLIMGEKQKRKMLEQLSSESEITIAKNLNEQALIQEHALRLLMASLSRQSDPALKPKTKELRKLLSETNEFIQSAVESMKQEHKISSALDDDLNPPDFKMILDGATIFLSVTSITW